MKDLSLEKLLRLIPKKENGTITARRLAEIAGCCESYIRKKINEARASGIPICSTRFGYYFSDRYEDISETVRFLTRRINTQLKAIDGLKGIKFLMVK